MNHSPYRVGVIGLGAIAAAYGTPDEATPYCHVGGIRLSARVQLAAAADLSDAAREQFTQTWGVAFPDTPLYSSSAAMLEAQPLDIVAVCVRGPYHFAVMQEVLNAPRPPRAIFLEKPPSCSLQEMDEMMALAREKKVCVTVSYSRHWNPRTLKMAQLVREGLIGRVHTIVGYNGGTILSFASHTTDLICQFGGLDVRAVRARGRLVKDGREGYEPEPTLEHLTLEFESGALGVQVGAHGERGQFYVDVFGVAGRARVGMSFEPQAFDAENQPMDIAAQIPPMASVFQVAYEQIADYLDGGAKPDCSDEAFQTINEIGFAAIESLHCDGARVELPNRNRSRRIWANG